MILRELSKHDKFYIYGAQVVAYGAFCAIRHLTGKEPQSFLVGNPANNPAVIDGVPVTTSDKAAKDALVIVAVTELLQPEIARFLQTQGFSQVVLLTADAEHRLMGAYFADLKLFLPATPQGKVAADLVMYEVMSHRDKILHNRPKLKPFERTIQAGAAIAERRLATLTDDTGDNISRQNRQYCEMTAVYWVWKNTTSRWVGIEHYRRHLLVQPMLLHEDVDAILPLPYMAYPNTLAQFGRFVDQEVIEALWQTLNEAEPNKFDEYTRILQGKYQYTYNLLCAKREVFADYCAWFFGLTRRLEKKADKAPTLVETRALSYVAEVLTNLYFMSRQNKLNIRHTAKAIFV